MHCVKVFSSLSIICLPSFVYRRSTLVRCLSSLVSLVLVSCLSSLVSLVLVTCLSSLVSFVLVSCLSSLVYRSSSLVSLKVHKIEIFIGFDLEICNISLIIRSNIKILQQNFFDWASIGGGTIFPRSLKTTGNEKKFWARSKKYFFFFSFMNPLYEPKLVFTKFDPLTASGMALCVDLRPKCQNLFPLVWD